MTVSLYCMYYKLRLVSHQNISSRLELRIYQLFMNLVVHTNGALRNRTRDYVPTEWVNT